MAARPSRASGTGARAPAGGQYRIAEVPADAKPLTLPELELLEAVRAGNGEAVRVLAARYGVDVNCVDYLHSAGQRPVHVAVMAERADSFQTLLETGADPNGRDAQDRTVLHYVARTGNVALLRAILDAVSAVNAAAAPEHRRVLRWKARTRGTRQSPLYVAVVSGHAAMVRAMLEVPGVRETLELRASNGETPLLGACRLGHVEVLEALLGAGAHSRARTTTATGAMGVAAVRGHRRILEVLLHRCHHSLEEVHDPVTGASVLGILERGGFRALAWELQAQETALRLAEAERSAAEEAAMQAQEAARAAEEERARRERLEAARRAREAAKDAEDRAVLAEIERMRASAAAEAKAEREAANRRRAQAARAGGGGAP